MSLISWYSNQNWPKITAGVAVTLIVALGVVATGRAAFGLIFPGGYDTYIWALVALTGVAGAWGTAHRATDYTLAAIKAGDPAILAAVASMPSPPTSVDAPAASANPPGQ